MIILGFGSRAFKDYSIIELAVSQFDPKEDVFISGAAKGADTLVIRAAKNLGFDYEEFPADWNKHGKGAGPIRNRQMADEQPDMAIGFADGDSRGAIDMAGVCVVRCIPVLVWNPKRMDDKDLWAARVLYTANNLRGY